MLSAVSGRWARVLSAVACMLARGDVVMMGCCCWLCVLVGPCVVWSVCWGSCVAGSVSLCPCVAVGGLASSAQYCQDRVSVCPWSYLSFIWLCVGCFVCCGSECCVACVLLALCPCARVLLSGVG